MQLPIDKNATEIYQKSSPGCIGWTLMLQRIGGGEELLCMNLVLDSCASRSPNARMEIYTFGRGNGSTYYQPTKFNTRQTLHQIRQI